MGRWLGSKEAHRSTSGLGELCCYNTHIRQDFGFKLNALTSSISIIELHSEDLVQLRDRIVYNGHSNEL